MKVLLVAAANVTSGGGERHVADLLRHLPAHGVETGLACPGGGDLTDLARSLGVPVFSLEIASGLTPGSCAQMRRALRVLEPEVVHAHGSRAAFHARVADPLARRRCVYTVHGIHVDRAGSGFRRAVLLSAERALRPRTAAFITVCESDLHKGTRLGVIDPSSTTVIHNGIEIPEVVPAPTGAFRAELGVAADAPLVLSVGRLHGQKDHETLLRAWSIVVRDMPQARLAIIGSGPLRPSLVALTASLDIGSTLRILPKRRSLTTAYADATLFALSSRWEGFPYVVLEAMSHGLAVVSTDVDGVPEAVEQNVTGLLVPACDPEALAAALVALLGDPARARTLAKAGRERVEREFTLEAMLAATMGVYADVSGVATGTDS